MNSCGKRSYSKKEAQEMKNYLERKHNGPRLIIYPCPHGNHWHLSSHRNKSKINQR